LESAVGVPGSDLLVVSNLAKFFPVQRGLLQREVAWIRAVDNVSFSLRDGETLGLVGESGCGKTTVARTILRLTPANEGQVLFEGQDVFKAEGRDLKALRRKMGIIYQNPFSSLDPRMRVGEIIGEGLRIHGIGDARQRRATVLDMLRKVGLEEYHADRYPREFSAGQRQRIGVARVLSICPKFVVCDEPVSALDLSVQAQVINLLRELQDELHVAYLFIAHNLSVVEHISDRVAVMYLGKIVELAGRLELYQSPHHPYTRALMSAIPIPDPCVERDRIILSGDVPSPMNPPSGCRFHPRCPVAMTCCAEQEPELREVHSWHWSACWRAE